MDRSLKNGEEDPSVITEINVHAVLLYAQGKLDQVPRRRRLITIPKGGKMRGHRQDDTTVFSPSPPLFCCCS